MGAGRAGEDKKEKRVTYFRKILNYVFQNVNAIFFSTFFANFFYWFCQQYYAFLIMKKKRDCKYS